jgi:hypothetical protein
MFEGIKSKLRDTQTERHLRVPIFGVMLELRVKAVPKKPIRLRKIVLPKRTAISEGTTFITPMFGPRRAIPLTSRNDTAAHWMPRN